MTCSAIDDIAASEITISEFIHTELAGADITRIDVKETIGLKLGL